jgi:hypothetical protein
MGLARLMHRSAFFPTPHLTRHDAETAARQAETAARQTRQSVARVSRQMHTLALGDRRHAGQPPDGRHGNMVMTSARRPLAGLLAELPNLRLVRPAVYTIVSAFRWANDADVLAHTPYTAGDVQRLADLGAPVSGTDVFMVHVGHIRMKSMHERYATPEIDTRHIYTEPSHMVVHGTCEAVEHAEVRIREIMSIHRADVKFGTYVAGPARAPVFKKEYTVLHTAFTDANLRRFAAEHLAMMKSTVWDMEAHVGDTAELCLERARADTLRAKAATERTAVVRELLAQNASEAFASSVMAFLATDETAKLVGEQDKF